MDEEQMRRQAAALVSQMDQAQAVFGGIGTALAKLYRGLVEGGVPRQVAGKIATDVGRAWADGTFGKG